MANAARASQRYLEPSERRPNGLLDPVWSRHTGDRRPTCIAYVSARLLSCSDCTSSAPFRSSDTHCSISAFLNWPCRVSMSPRGLLVTSTTAVRLNACSLLPPSIQRHHDHRRVFCDIINGKQAHLRNLGLDGLIDVWSVRGSLPPGRSVHDG